jgi:hypothetical protein
LAILRFVLRAAVQPLTPAHVVAAYAGMPGSGFGPEDASSIAGAYYETVMAAAIDPIKDDTVFQGMIKDLIYPPTKKAIVKLTPRNQFMALSKAVPVCLATPEKQGSAIHLMTQAPFVLTLSTLAALEAARLTDAEPETTDSRLSGFVEHHIGCVAGIFLE